MQLREALISAAERLTRAGVADSRKDAELLLMFALGRDRAYLYAHPEHPLTNEESARYDDALAKRSLGMPPQYITGHQEFWGMDFIVSPAVLIPRPETEHLVETVVELARNVERPRIVDVGTGSGCIALALAKELPLAEVHAVDISKEALEIARSNAARLSLEKRVCFQESDLLAFSTEGEEFDFIVSNPPYISAMERESLQREVRDFEPEVALFGGKMGLDVIERLAQQAGLMLKSGGWLVMEIGTGQQIHIQQLLANWRELRFANDLQGIARVAAAQTALNWATRLPARDR